MNFLKTFLLAASLVNLCFFSTAQTGFVHQQGQTLQNGVNQTIKLQGVNLGGWLSWEGWIWGGGFDSHTKMEKLIQKGTDSLYMLKFRDSVYNYFIQPKDLQKIKALGLNCVRIPINYRVLLNQSSGDTLNFKQLDSVVTWCKAAGLYAILDLHAAPGGQNKYFSADPELIDLWSSEKNKLATLNLWRSIATHFQNDTTVAAYDLLNEPNIKESDSLVSFYKRLIREIRSVDTNHLLIIEGNEFARDFSFFPKHLDNNMMFSFHFYPWYQGVSKRQKTLLNYSRQSAYFQTPFWCGEWGEDERTELYRNRNFLMSDLYAFAGTAFWTWKNVKFRKRPVLNKIEASDDISLVMNGYKPKETSDQKAVFDEFLRKMNVDFVNPNPELIKMLKSLTDGTKVLKK